MGHDISGINESGIDILISEIYDCDESLKKEMNTLDDLVSSTSEFYQCDTANKYRNRYTSIKDNFEQMNKNILGLVDEMSNVKNNYHKRSDDIVTSTNNYIGMIGGKKEV